MMTDPTIAHILARLDVIERRLGIVQTAHPFVLDDIRRIITCPNGKTARLSPSEWAIITRLLTQPRQVVSFQELKYVIWNSDWMDISNITVLVYALRQKIETDPHHPRYIVNKKNAGYAITWEDDGT
jgi:two-component system KDP operon response regulator KdpE